MESEGGWQEPPGESRVSFFDLKVSADLSPKELDRITDGEPYCFRCGKPASSFSEYEIGAESEDLANAWQYVLQEEGTYNDDTNRFACDACYIALGMPAAPGGWRAP